tara:strand:+ start:2475 stop:4805 length:2331 start_codon:yes stop_codon:yes gene_type:complete
MALPEAIFRNAIDLNRYGNKVSTDIARRFVDICVDSVQQIAVLERVGLGDSYRANRLRSIVAQMEKSLSGWKKYANKQVITELQGLAKVEAGFIENQLNKLVPSAAKADLQINGIQISPKFAESIVTIDPTRIKSRAVGQQLARFLGETTLSDSLGANITLPNGNIMQQAFNRIAENSVQLFRSSVEDGLYTGESIAQITKRLIGNSKTRDTANILQMAQKGGILTSPPINQVRTLVRTSVNQVSNTAALNVYKANSKVTKKYEYVATLDSRTSAVCSALDGRVFAYEDGPKPPQHFNCRSTIVPEIDYDNLPFDPPKGIARRSSVDGLMPASMNYGEWLYMQPNKVQAQILGGKLNPKTNKYEGAFRYFQRLASKNDNPRQALSKFVRADGSRITLTQLKARYGKPENIPIVSTPVPKPAKVAPRKAPKDTYAPTVQPKIAISRGKDIVAGRLASLDGFRKEYKGLLRQHTETRGEISVIQEKLNAIVRKMNKTSSMAKFVELDKTRDPFKAAKAVLVTKKQSIRADLARIEKQGTMQMFELRKEAIANSTITSAEAKEAIKNISFIGQKKGRDLIKADLEEFALMFNGGGITKRGRKIKYRPNQIDTVKIASGRAHNTSSGRGGSLIKVPAESTGYFGENDVRATVFHEAAHSLEGFNEKNASLAIAFRNNRVKSLTPVSPKNLKGTISDGYSLREAVLKDSFISPYVGRPYRTSSIDTNIIPKGVKAGEVFDEATEVISMGAEHFSDPENMFRLYQADPEHFYMILSLTRTTY